MTIPDLPYPLLKAEDIAAMAEETRIHSLNPKAIRNTRSLGDATGLHHIGIHLVRLEPGHDSTQYHVHQGEEEFIYIVSGRGLAELGEDRVEVGPGDFMGFAPGGLPHNLHNPFTEDLVYLVGGMRLDFDICDYPRVGKRLYRSGLRYDYGEIAQQEPFLREEGQ